MLLEAVGVPGCSAADGADKGVDGVPPLATSAKALAAGVAGTVCTLTAAAAAGVCCASVGKRVATSVSVRFGSQRLRVWV